MHTGAERRGACWQWLEFIPVLVSQPTRRRYCVANPVQILKNAAGINMPHEYPRVTSTSASRFESTRVGLSRISGSTSATHTMALTAVHANARPENIRTMLTTTCKNITKNGVYFSRPDIRRFEQGRDGPINSNLQQLKHLLKKIITKNILKQTKNALI